MCPLPSPCINSFISVGEMAETLRVVSSGSFRSFGVCSRRVSWDACPSFLSRLLGPYKGAALPKDWVFTIARAPCLTPNSKPWNQAASIPKPAIPSPAPGLGRNHSAGHRKPVPFAALVSAVGPENECTESSRGPSQQEISTINLAKARVVHSPVEARELVCVNRKPVFTSRFYIFPSLQKVHGELGQKPIRSEKNQKYRRQPGYGRSGCSRQGRKWKYWPQAR